MKTAQDPFRFFTASYLIRVGNMTALTPAELLKGLEKCSDASIFYHTFQSLSRHHFLTEGFSNDFAQWVLGSCNQPQLAEGLAGLDIRDYTALADLRRDLRRVVEEFCVAHPNQADQKAFEPFYFNEGIEVTVPLGFAAQTLEQFREGIRRLSHASLYFHFIASRLRLHLRTNDFSLWLGKELGLESLAQKLNFIDIYTNTLESARERLLGYVEQELTP